MTSTYATAHGLDTVEVDLTARDGDGREMTRRRELIGRTAVVHPHSGSFVGTVTAVDHLYLVVTRADGAWYRTGSLVELVTAA